MFAGKGEEKPEPKEPAKEPEADKTSSRVGGAAFQFAAFLQEAPEADKTESSSSSDSESRNR